MSLIDLRLTCFHSIKKHEQPLLLSAHIVISMQTYLPSSFGLNELCVSPYVQLSRYHWPLLPWILEAQKNKRITYPYAVSLQHSGSSLTLKSDIYSGEDWAF